MSYYCGACKESVEHVLFECASYDSQDKIFRLSEASSLLC